MLTIKKIILGVIALWSGSLIAQQPGISVTFKSDKSITESIEITFNRQTQTLPAFGQAGSTVVFRTGLAFNTDYFLDAIARRSNVRSKSFSFTVVATNPTPTITVSLKPNVPANEQITFANDSGRLTERRVGL